jgi:spermidine synthase
MIRWEELDTAAVPDDGGDLRLMRRGTEYSIMAGPIELMNSRLSGSEEALASLCVQALAGRPVPRFLIGGLGMGFTLRAALALLPPGARVTVAELIPAVVAWARGPLAHIHGASLDDPRVALRQGDVRPVIAAEAAAWDAIVLDVDNGPEGLTRKANDAIYSPSGLAAAHRALTPGGVLAVWSSAPSEPFARRLARAGFTLAEHRVRAGGRTKGARHVIWLGTKAG